MLARDVMTAPALSVRTDATLVEALDLMAKHGVSGLTVVDDDGLLVGVLTEGDLLRRAEIGSQGRRPRWVEFLLGSGREAADYIQANSRRVRDLMTDQPLSLPEDATLAEVADLMMSGDIKRIPIVRQGRPVGIVSRSDLTRALLRRIHGEARLTLDDEDIAEALRDELRSRRWYDPDMVKIAAADGVVTLSGFVLDERTRQALRVAAGNVPGVRRVVDDLTWMEPLTGATVPPPPA